MGSESLADRLADRLLDQVVRGELRVDEALPSEAEIAAQAGVSRLTVREAVTVLRTKNIVRIRRGRGTYVNAPDRWTDLELVLRTVGRGAGTAVRELLEVRRVLETGAARLCAARRTDADLALLAAHTTELDKAAAAGDGAAFARADADFHETVLRSCGNVFIPVVCAPVDRTLARLYGHTVDSGPVRRRTQEHHHRILAEVSAAAPEAAATAMADHLGQIIDDLSHHGPDRAVEAARDTSEPSV